VFTVSDEAIDKLSSYYAFSVGYHFRLPCSCASQRRHLALSDGSCDLQGGTVKATYHVPCKPGCGVEPLSLPAPTDSPTLSPTEEPTAAPTESPTPAPTQCIPKLNIEQEDDFGSYSPSEEILELLKQSQDGKTVTVQLNQVWKLTGM